MGDQPKEKGYKGYSLTPKEKRGRVKTDMSTWRTKLQASKITFDDLRKGMYLRHLSQNGRKMQAAQAAGVAAKTVLDHYNNDPEFADAVEQALKAWADKVHMLAWKLMNGIEKPVIGVDKGTSFVIGKEMVHATNLLSMELKRTNPEYKERSEIDINAKGGGVLVVPAGLTPQQWEAQAKAHNVLNEQEPGSDETGA